MDEVAFNMKHKRMITFWQMDLSISDEENGTKKRGGNQIANVYRGPISLDTRFLNTDLQF